IHAVTHDFFEPGGIFREAPLQARDLPGYADRLERGIRRAGRGQKMPNQHDRVAHHVVQHAAALQVAAPKPRLVRTTMLLRGPRQIRSPGDGDASGPDDIAAGRNRWRKELIFEVSMAKADSVNTLDDPLRLTNISCERFLAGHAFKRTPTLFNRRHDLFDIFDTRVIR